MSEQQSLNGDGTITIKTSSWNRVVRERDELKQFLAADSERVDAYLGVCIEQDEARSVADGLAEQAERLRKERDEAREALKHIDEYGTEEINAAVELRQKLAQALVERDEAREKAERYRLDANALMLQRDEARERLAKIKIAAEAVIDRWKQPAWKDTEPTATVIYRLRDAINFQCVKPHSMWKKL